MITQVESYLRSLQEHIMNALCEVDAHSFFIDEWTKPTSAKMSGYGKTCVLSDGTVFERAGVNFSYVSGDSLPASATANRPELSGKPWSAIGVSLVIHPHNPFVPTAHMNVRFFVAGDNTDEPIWWFGGGYDLTPYFGFDEDCVHWHSQAKQACDSFQPDAYARYKHWCDEYFYLKHRDEPRGIGGIFFDDVSGESFSTCFDFLQAVGNSFVPAYLPIVYKRKDTEYTQEHKDFQLYRRGRYVEFNLVYDRGTIFGLQSGGRTESILMSMPPQVSFSYMRSAQTPDEERLYSHYLTNKDWIPLQS